MSTQNDLLDQLPGYFVIKSTTSIYQTANTKAANVLGFKSSTQLIGKTDHDLNCEAAQYASRFIEEDQLTLQHGKLKFISHFCYAKDEWKTCLYEKSVIRHANGEQSIGCYVTDITDSSLIDISRYLLEKDSKYHHQQFSYLIRDHDLQNLFSTREAECLFFILRGKSSKMIANILNISAKTVEYYVEQLKLKLSCRNKSELIEKSLAQGYLYLLPETLINVAPMKNRLTL